MLYALPTGPAGAAQENGPSPARAPLFVSDYGNNRVVRLSAVGDSPSTVPSTVSYVRPVWHGAPPAISTSPTRAATGW